MGLKADLYFNIMLLASQRGRRITPRRAMVVAYSRSGQWERILETARYLGVSPLELLQGSKYDLGRMAGWPPGVLALWGSPLRERLGVSFYECESLARIEYRGRRLATLDDALLTLVKLRRILGFPADFNS